MQHITKAQKLEIMAFIDAAIATSQRQLDYDKEKLLNSPWNSGDRWRNEIAMDERTLDTRKLTRSVIVDALKDIEGDAKNA